MREIQDLTLNVERGLASIDQRFAIRAEQFSHRFQRFARGESHHFGVRMTAQPLTQIYVEHVFKNPRAAPPLKRLEGSVDNSGPIELVVSHDGGGSPSPLIRGARWDVGNDHFDGRREVFCDGLFEYTFLIKKIGNEHFCLFPTFFMGLVGNALCAAERFRLAAETPTAEYGMEVEVCNSGGTLPIAGYGGAYGSSFGPLPEGRFIFPRYGIGRLDAFPRLVAAIERDFWNACGHDWDSDFKIDFDKAFKALGIGDHARH